MDQAAPLQGWDLPEEFATLRRLMEGRMAKHGRREYVQVLRLLESFEIADLHAAVKQAASAGRWLIMISGKTKLLPRLRTRALGTRSARRKL